MGVFKNLFTWWEGASFGTWVGLLGASKVGEDASGTVYFEGKAMPDGRRRRYARYAGLNDASRIPPDWYSWLHHQTDGPPDRSLPPSRAWEKAPKPNLTGTNAAYRPAGALEAGGKRAAATGDYEAWSPDAA